MKIVSTIFVLLVCSATMAFGLPDLYVDSFTAPSQAEPGEAVGDQLGVVAGNQGDEDAGGFSVGLYISEDPVITTGDRLLIGGREFVGSLGAGSVYDVPLYAGMSIPGDLTPGDYYIGVLLDEFDAVPESDETNNYDSLPIYIGTAIADLYVDSFTAPAEALPGEVIGDLLGVVAGNQGGEDAGGFSVGLYISEDPVITTGDQLLIGGREFVGSLGAGSVYDVPLYSGMSVPWYMTPGSYYIGALLDEFDAVPESDETNNYDSLPFTILGEGGLEVFVEDYPFAVGLGEILSFTAGVVNNGSDPASFDEALMVVSGPASLTRSLYSGADITLVPAQEVSTQVDLFVPTYAPLGWYTVEVEIYDNGSFISSATFRVEVIR